MVAAVFGEISAREKPERSADGDADRGHDDRAGYGVQQAAFARSRRRGVLGEDLQVDAGHAVVNQREQDQRQPGDTENRGANAEQSHDQVFAAAGSVNRVHFISPPCVPNAAASAAPSPARKTSAGITPTPEE